MYPSLKKSAKNYYFSSHYLEYWNNKLKYKQINLHTLYTNNTIQLISKTYSKLFYRINQIK